MLFLPLKKIYFISKYALKQYNRETFMLCESVVKSPIKLYCCSVAEIVEIFDTNISD